MIEELVKEQDKWHRRYNDALIEIAKLTAENTNLECAIKKLIQERDCAIKDLNHHLENECNRYLCMNGDQDPCPINCKWRGVRR